MKTSRPLFLLIVLAGLTACEPFDECDDVYCTPCRAFTNEVVIGFNRDTLARGFRAAEMAGAYVVRYRSAGFAQPRDTLRLTTGGRATEGFNTHALALMEAYSMYDDTLKAHSYRVVLPNAGRQYDLSAFELAAQLDTDGCCNCPYNVRRRFVLDGRPVVADGFVDFAVQLGRP